MLLEFRKGVSLQRLLRINSNTLFYLLLLLGICSVGFFESVGAQINSTSKVEVPLPKAFGEPGSVAVSAPVGAVSDSIPIELAPGRRGIKPRLALSYNSLGGTGIAGLGWSIGIGRVERWRGDGIPSVRATVGGSQDDRFSYSLGGAGGELHDQNGDGSYRARIESVYRPFSKQGSGWSMFDGRGVRYSFGSSENSRIDGELWMLDKIVDPFGNTVTYHYGKECAVKPAASPCIDASNERLYLSAIEYTGFEPTADSGANRILFEYEYRPDRRLSYLRGVRESQNLRLSRVSVLARGDLVRRYQLSYTRYAEGPSLLSQVTLIGADGMTAVTLRTLEYGQRPTGWAGMRTESIPVDLVTADGDNNGVQLMDVNGDGYADLVNNGIEVYLGDGLGGFSLSNTWTNAIDEVDISLVGENGLDTGVRMMDVNGDARPDIMIASPDRTEVWLNTGSQWLLDSAWTASLGSLSALNIALTDAGASTNCLAPHCDDFGANAPAGCSPSHCTGNEENDTANCIPPHSDPDQILHCAVPNFSALTTENFSLVGSQGESKGVELADVNADGRVDIIWSLKFDQTRFLNEIPRIVRAIFLNGGSDYPGWHVNETLSNALATVLTNDDNAAGAFIVENTYQGYSLADVNGDGFADILRSIEDKQAVYLGNGSGWSFDDGYTSSMIENGIFALNADLKSQGLIPMDFNDDGLPDYVRSDGELRIAYVNTGIAWASDRSVAHLMSQALQNRGINFASAEGKSTGTTLSDIDGDGISDIVRAQSDVQNRILLTDTLRSGKLLRAVGALGDVTEVSWALSTSFDNSSVSGIEGLPISMQLVERLTRSDGRGGLFVTDFDYGGGQYIDQGFRGFARVSTLPSAGLRTETLYYQDEARATQPFEVRAFDSNSNLRALSLSDTAVVDAEPGVQQILLERTETRRIDQDGTTNISRVIRAYDDRMQPISIFNDAEVGPFADDRTTEYTWARNDQAGIWSLLARGIVSNASSERLSESITLYDDMPQGMAVRGLPSATREWVEGITYLTQEFVYDQFGNVKRVVDRAGNETIFDYDVETSTFRVAGTDALGRVKRSSYDYRFGTLERDEDANGNATLTTYDAFGRKSRVVAPGDEDSPYGTVTFLYSAIGNPEQQFYKLLRTENAGTGDVFETTTFFDAAGKVYETREEGANGFPVITRIEFGEDGQPNASSLPFFEGDIPVFISTARDDLGRLVEIVDPLGQKVSMSYSGLELGISNARGNTTRVTSNAKGDPVEVAVTVDGAMQTTKYRYDALGRMTSLVDALGHETRISYDGLDRRTRLEDPNAGVFEYRYDGEGRLIEQIGPDGNSMLLSYSAAGEMVEKILPDGSVHRFRYGTGDTPNAAGRVVEVHDAAGILRIEYDRRGRVVERRRSVGGRTYLTGFVYDSMDRVRRVIYPDGFAVDYMYDAGNTLAAIVDQDGRPIASDFQYNAAKRITEFTFGNGVISESSYDTLARMLMTRASSPTGIDLQELVYTYDSANNVLSLDDLAAGTRQSFEYDEENRLVRAMGPYGEELYAYDAIGNLLQKGDLYFAHDPQHPQRISCGVEVWEKRARGKANSSAVDDCADSFVGALPGQVRRAFALTYDARGNVITKGRQRFEYDGENRLIRVTAANGRLIERNRYDASGEIVVRQNRNDKTVYIEGLYEEGKTHVSRHVLAGSLLVATVITPRANVELIADIDRSPGERLYYAGIPGLGVLFLLVGPYSVFGRRVRRALAEFLVACREHPTSIALVFFLVFSSWPQTGHTAPGTDSDREKRYYYHANHLGSVNVVTDDEAKVTARRDYRPYGDPYDWSGSRAGPRELLQTFQGQQFDDNTGFYYFKARYYDPELGRFLSADTIVSDSSDPRTLNRYAFAGGNPVQFVDPTGRGFFSAVGDFFTGVAEGAVDAANWVADNAVEILTVAVIVVVVILVVALAVSTGGLAGFALAGAAIGFATFGGIALAQGNTVADAAFWQAAGTGAVLGALVGAALPVAWGSIGLGPIAAGALIGAAAGGLEQAIACATGCGGVENLLLPVAHGIIVGGIIGAIGGGLAGKYLGSKGSRKALEVGKGKSVLRFLIEPGKVGFAAKTFYSTYSSAGGQGLGGRRTIGGDVFRFTAIGVGASDERSGDVLTKPDNNSTYFFGLLDNVDIGLSTSPTTP